MTHPYLDYFTFSTISNKTRRKNHLKSNFSDVIGKMCTFLYMAPLRNNNLEGEGHSKLDLYIEYFREYWIRIET